MDCECWEKEGGLGLGLRDWDWVNFLGSCDSVKLEHRYNWVSGFPGPVINTFWWDEINLTSFCHLINGDDKNADNPSCSQGSHVVVDCPTQLTSISMKNINFCICICHELDKSKSYKHEE